MNKKFKRLAITSDCVHYHDEGGNVVTENHIFCRQMQSLASAFEQTTVYCPFDRFSKEKVTSMYTLPTLRFVPLPNVGGNSLKDKIKILRTVPVWLRAFKNAYKESDIIYQRFPNNLNIPGFFYFRIKKARVFATYTGTWNNYENEPSTYRLQKWILKHFFPGPVAAYIRQSQIGNHIFKTFSPSYTWQEWNEEAEQVEMRIRRLRLSQTFIPVFITVGALVKGKNQQYILNEFKTLYRDGFQFKLYIVGDGVLKSSYERFIEENGLASMIYVTGKKNYAELRALYREVNFVVQATLVEGFGKVPIEGFFHGVIPILNNLNLAAEMTGNMERGFLFSANEKNSLVKVVKGIYNKKELLSKMIYSGREYAKVMTLESWTNSTIELINTHLN
jgi:glycosyltransferase involved in cell wall biosynthesis